jgi:hypothetical protein
VSESPSGDRDSATPRDVLLVEYQKAQDSAEHHDDLVWSITALNWVGSAVLMGFVLSGLTDSHPSWGHKIALLSIAFVGFGLSVCVWRWARQVGAMRNHKYGRCKEIEQSLGMRQHTEAPWRGRQRREYSFLMSAFLATWIVLAVVVAIQ